MLRGTLSAGPIVEPKVGSVANPHTGNDFATNGWLLEAYLPEIPLGD